MQDYKKHNNILIQSTANSRTYEWKIIKLVRSLRHFSIKQIKKNIIHLNENYRSLRISYVNPYCYWGHKQLTIHTTGMKFHTIWYD